MIRRSLFLFSVLVVVLWFGIAYLVKHRFISIIEQLGSDHFKFCYNEILVTGFPYSWKIKITAPKIHLTDHTGSYQFATESLTSLVELGFKKTIFSIDGDLIYIQNIRGVTTEYHVNAQDNLTAIVNFTQSLLHRLPTQYNLLSFVQSCTINNKSIAISADSKPLFNISSLSLLITNNLLSHGTNILLELKANYEAQEKFLAWDNAAIAFEALVKFTQDKDNNVLDITELTISNFYVTLEDAKIRLHGVLDLPQNDLPHGNFFVNLSNYNRVVDLVIPDVFFISKPLLKDLLTRTTSDIELKDVYFDLTFSERGINIDSMNLMDIEIGN